LAIGKVFTLERIGSNGRRAFSIHRLCDDERGEQLQAKVNYIRQNPVVAGLCASAEEWSWVIDRSSQLLG